jgi:hypothetical protein
MPASKRSGDGTTATVSIPMDRRVLSFVLPCYSPVPADKSSFHIARFVDTFMERLKCFFESIPYDP